MAALADLRARVAALLAGLAPADDDWPVHAGPVDAITAPAYLLVWGPAPWLAPVTMCNYTARLTVVCVGARMDPAAGYEQVEALVGAAVAVLDTAPFSVAVDPPAPFEHGGLQYQAARISLACPITLGGT